MITVSYELQHPNTINIGGLKWFVRVKHKMPYYLRNDGSFELMNIANKVCSEIYFKDEVTAHAHAAGYYSKHNKPYPHNVAGGNSQNSKSIELKQETMRFD